MATTPGIMTTTEVMAALRVKNAATLVGLRKPLRAFRVGRHWRYPEAAVIAYASGASAPAPADAPQPAELPDWAQGVHQTVG